MCFLLSVPDFHLLRFFCQFFDTWEKLNGEKIAAVWNVTRWFWLDMWWKGHLRDEMCWKHLNWWQNLHINYTALQLQWEKRNVLLWKCALCYRRSVPACPDCNSPPNPQTSALQATYFCFSFFTSILCLVRNCHVSLNISNSLFPTFH